MTQPSEKRLPTILKARLLISLIEGCCASGEDEIVNSLCKSMMQSLSSIPKEKRIELFQEFWKAYESPSYWQEVENLLSLTE